MTNYQEVKQINKRCQLRMTLQKDGRYYCEYINKNDPMLSGIGQFGKTPFEAEINLQAVLNVLNRERYKLSFKLAK